MAKFKQNCFQGMCFGRKDKTTDRRGVDYVQGRKEGGDYSALFSLATLTMEEMEKQLKVIKDDIKLGLWRNRHQPKSLEDVIGHILETPISLLINEITMSLLNT
ncbi:hypothetical protein [Formosa sp. L2A11]|uniref:hypothetical protein n=1 Tax=Formosa sp. L2A11 TaxID=2686363 RepID=UPI0018EECE3E|nr:hypothetical protein [Formosa sp. L2A11]